MAERIYELMRKVQVGPITIRMWLASDARFSNFADADRFTERVKSALCKPSVVYLPEVVVDTIEAIVPRPTINAIEVLNLAGNGALVYPEWP